MKVTLDTSILPADDLIASVPSGRFEFSIVSVTDREMGGSETQVNISNIPETMVLGESCLGQAVLGDSADASCLEFCLKIISDSGFPPPDKRDKLTSGERRQLRDAMIFCAHLRNGGKIFVTNDEKGFINDDRRVKLENVLYTRIMTRDEFQIEFGEKV